MSIISLTGTELSRFNEIEDRWVNFEASSDPRAYNYNLYSVPHGQSHGSEFVVLSGVVQNSSGSIEIEKRIHIFEDEVEAGNFINDVGLQNIASYSESFFLRSDGTSYKKIEVHLINYSQLLYEFSLLNNTVSRGFKVEVFFSNSVGLKEVEKKVEFNLNGEVINDSYLKYFDITGE